jgi:uncharacterized protein (TIGR02598 family)
MKSPIVLAPRRVAGFTLAEVMIALGIVASVMVAMLGMIPHAITSIRESNNLTIMGRIAQEVISDIQMSDWDQIEQDYKGKTFQYDNEGLPFEGRQGQQPTYEARIELPQERVSLGSNLEYQSDIARKIKVEVEYIPGGIPNKDKEIRRRNTKLYHFVVANQNKLKVK